MFNKSKKIVSIIIVMAMVITCGILVAKPSEVQAASVVKIGKVTTASDNLIIRSGAGSSYSEVDRIPKGTLVKVTDTSNASWYKISVVVLYNNQPVTRVGYVSSTYMTIMPTSAKILENTNTYLAYSTITDSYKEYNRVELQKVPRGGYIEATGIQEYDKNHYYYQVYSYSGQLGYVDSSDFFLVP